MALGSLIFVVPIIKFGYIKFYMTNITINIVLDIILAVKPGNIFAAFITLRIIIGLLQGA